MTTLNSCPRCGGQTYEESDRYGRYRTCLQCGQLTPIDAYDPEGKTQPAYRGKARTPRLRGLTYKQRHR